MVERRHNEELTLRLERVADTGHATLTKGELQRWYDIQRVAARTRRDMVERWQEIVDDGSRSLHCIERADSFLLLDGGAIKALIAEE